MRTESDCSSRKRSMVGFGQMVNEASARNFRACNDLLASR